MNKKFVFVLLSLLSFAGTASAQKYWITNDTAAHNLVWEDKLYRRIEFLSDSLCAGRAASGTVAMMSLSDMFSAMRRSGRVYGHNIIFVAFDGKEMNMAGSAAFWKMIEDGDLKNPLTGETVTKDKISLMVNIDQAGSSLAPLKSGRRDYMIMLGGHTLDKEDLELLYMCNRFYGTHIELSETYYGSEDFTRVFYGISDHKVFADNGIPAVFFTSGITLNTFKTRDLPETLDMEVLRKRIILIYHWLEKILR